MIKEGIALCTITPVEEEKIEEEAVYVQQASDDSITKMIKEGIALCTINPDQPAWHRLSKVVEDGEALGSLKSSSR